MLSLSASSQGFAASTHARHWIWKTQAEVEAIRRRAQVVPRERLRRARAAAQQQQRTTPTSADENAMNVDAGASAAASALVGDSTAMQVSPAPAKKKKSASLDDQEPLSLEEEKQLRLFYVLQLTTMSGMLHLPTHVTHAAIIFFQRFFLRQSVMEYSPKDVAYCCIYLACKSEEHHLPLEKMIADITAASNPAAAAAAADPSAAASTVASNAKTVSTVLSLEVPVLSELKFQLRLYHLGRSSRGLVKELEETEPLQMSQGIYVNATDPALTSKGTPGTTLQSVSQYLSARATVLHDAALLTDAIFLHSPAQIALGCLVQAEQEAKTFAVDAQLDTSALGSTAQGAVKRLTVVQMFIEKNAQANSANPSPLAAKLASVQSFLTSGLSSPSSIDKKSLKSIEKRRKLLSNPSRDPNSAAAVQEQLERGHAKERKRAEKKRGQREEAGRREDALLMDDDPPAPEAPKAEFTISKRQKSLAGTPVSKHDLAAAGESDAMKDVDAPRSSMRLASQFDDAME